MPSTHSWLIWHWKEDGNKAPLMRLHYRSYIPAPLANKLAQRAA